MRLNLSFHDLYFSRVAVYNGRGTLEEDETAETRFIKIQAAYELLIDEEKRRQYDTDNRVNPMKVIFVICPPNSQGLSTDLHNATVPCFSMLAASCVQPLIPFNF